MPSSDPLTETVSRSDSSTTSGTVLRDDRVFIEEADAASARRVLAGLCAAAATRCFGANGGLLASGWKSIIGRRRCSQLYCLQRAIPLSRGIHVPDKVV